MVCEHEWEESNELYAITRLEKDGDKITFLPSVGIPIVVEVCKKCGEMKMFTATSKGKF